MIGTKQKDQSKGALAAALEAKGFRDSGTHPTLPAPTASSKEKGDGKSSGKNPLHLVPVPPTPAEVAADEVARRLRGEAPVANPPTMTPPAPAQPVSPPAKGEVEGVNKPPAADGGDKQKIETPPTPMAMTPMVATSGLSFEDLAALGAIRALPEGTEVRLPSGIIARRTATGVEIVQTTTPAPPAAKVEKQPAPPPTANEGWDPLAMLNPNMAAPAAQARAVAEGEAARAAQAERDRQAEARRNAEREAHEKRVRHTREVIGAQLPELLKSRKGGKAIAPFRNQEGKVDMGKLAEAFGGKCSFTGEKLAGKSYGTLLLVNEWAWMAGSRFDRETAIQLAKAEGRKLQAEAERKAAEKERAARRRELAEIEAKAAKLAAEVVKAAVKPGDSPVVKVGEKDLLPIPTRTPQLGAPPRVDWDGLKRAAKGTPDPFTGEKMEKPSGFLVFFPSKGSGVAERLKTAGFRLLGETAAMMLRKFPSLLAPCGEEWRFVELSGFTNTVDGLLRQAAEDQVSSKAGTARHHQRKRQRAQVDAASHKKGPSAEVPMRPLTRAERRAPPPPEKPIWRKKNRK